MSEVTGKWSNFKTLPVALCFRTTWTYVARNGRKLSWDSWTWMRTDSANFGAYYPLGALIVACKLQFALLEPRRNQKAFNSKCCCSRKADAKREGLRLQILQSDWEKCDQVYRALPFTSSCLFVCLPCLLANSPCAFVIFWGGSLAW